MLILEDSRIVLNKRTVLV